jgi:hypothetical protein
MEDAGIEPATSRMQSERSATELNPLDDILTWFTIQKYSVHVLRGSPWFHWLHKFKGVCCTSKYHNEGAVKYEYNIGKYNLGLLARRQAWKSARVN